MSRPAAGWSATGSSFAFSTRARGRQALPTLDRLTGEIAELTVNIEMRDRFGITIRAYDLEAKTSA
jgi:hypothetical protein